MRKIIIVLTSLTIAIVVIAQSTTNNLTVILPAVADNAVKAAWQYDNGLRTNGFAPYTNTLPAQTFKEFVEGTASEALLEKVQNIEARMEALMLQKWRAASLVKRKAALNALQ